MARNLKHRQIEAIKCMLNFNTPASPGDVPQWKVLIYDKAGRDIISLLLSVKELRALGVTLHLLIDSPREHIPDVPAVYFVYPTEENVIAICKDFEFGKYETYYLNFISPISRTSLETLAQTALSQECVQHITKVFDQFTNFVCLEDDLFILRPPSVDFPSYYALNRSKTTDADIEAAVDTIVEGLFSVFATLGSVPIIRCPRGDASEMIATRLERRLRDCLQDTRKTLFLSSDSTTRGFTGDLGGSASGTSGPGSTTGSFSNLFQRPLLIMLDRNLDPATPLQHDLTYQSLLHDLFNIRLNRIEADLSLVDSNADTDADGNSPQSRKGTKATKHGKIEKYDLSTTTDRLWRDFKNLPFPFVTDAIREEVTVLRDNEKRLNELKSTMGLSPDMALLAESSVTVLDDNTTHLKNAISSLPQLMERKRCLDMHTNIATCLVNVITKRQLRILIEEEGKLLSRQTKSCSDLCDVVKKPGVGTPEDKLRLVLLAALLRDDSSSMIGTSSGGSSGLSGVGPGPASGPDFRFSNEQLNLLVSALKEVFPEVDTSAVTYVQKQLRRSSRFCAHDDENTASRANTQNVLGKLVSHGSAIFQTGMQTLIGRKEYLPFTRIVSQLMDNKGGSEVEDYCYLDPKLQRRYNAEVPRIKQPFYEAYVFIVGGGCYVEYQNLLDWARTMSNSNSSSLTNLSSSSLTGSGHSSSLGLGSGWSSSGGCIRRITYGCTELVSPHEFLQQLTTLGRET